MFKNYILMALRTINKNRISSIIAVFGLALGLASSLLLFIYINYEFSYDNFIPKDKNIKRLISRTVDQYYYENYSANFFTTPTVENIRSEVTSIDELTSMTWSGDMTLISNGEFHFETLFFIEENFFNIIPFKVLEGDISTFTEGSNFIILEKGLADIYFPEGDALGKEIKLNHAGGFNLIVTGVVEVPKNSHFSSDSSMAFLPNKILNEISEFEYINDTKINEPTNIVYFRPVKGFDPQALQNELDSIQLSEPKNPMFSYVEYSYESFEKIHLFTKEHSNDVTNPIYILLFLLVLVVALLTISITNSISILIAGSINRTREIGVRQVMGGSKKDLIFQFLIESIVLSFISLIIALVLVEILLPGFSTLVFVDLELVFSIRFLTYTVLLALFVGIITGLYPAFYLSSLNVVECLKGKNLLKLGKFKKILLVVQFLFATIILIFSLTVNNELKHINSLDIGFDGDNLLWIYPGYEFDMQPYEKLQSLKHELLNIDGIEKITYTNYIPYYGGLAQNSIYKKPGGVTFIDESYTIIDTDYLEVVGINVLEGEVELNSVVVMESVREYRDIEVGDLIELDDNTYTVSAIIDDYCLLPPLWGESAKFHIVSDRLFYFQVLRLSHDIDIKNIEKIWGEFYPNRRFEYGFVSDEIEYQRNPMEVQILKKVTTVTTVIILFISFLGLFGLILHSIRQKNKEIGIRKVLGANLYSIIWQFSSEMLRYLIIGVLAGIPIGSFLITYGLSIMGYLYKLHDLGWISVFSALSIVITGGLLVLFMVLKSAKSNPSKALRYE